MTGDLALAADGSAGLRVIDISDPASPTEAGFLDTPGYALGVAVTGSLALVADLNEGLRVIDISDPTNPQEVGSADTPGSAYGVAVIGDLALVADGGSGLRLIDISDPTSPQEVGFFGTPGYAYGVVVSGDLALVADWDAGLAIVRLLATMAGSVTLQGQLDHSGTTISFNGPETGSAITGPDGSFSVALQAGGYVVRAGHPYHLPAEVTVEVRLGEPMNLVAELLCCDLDQDGDIDLEDLAQLSRNFNRREGPWR